MSWELERERNAMSRSGRSRRRWRSGWRSTRTDEPVAHLRVAPGPAHLVSVPSSQLDTGILVQVDLLARVLGVRLLRLSGNVLLVPGVADGMRRVTAPSPLPEAGTAVTDGSGPVSLLGRPAAATVPFIPRETCLPPVGEGIERARLLVDEASATLSEGRPTSE